MAPHLSSHATDSQLGTQKLNRFSFSPLTDLEKQELFGLLGLESMDYRFFELSGDLILHASRLGEVRPVSLLEPLHFEDQEIGAHEEPSVFVRYRSGRLPCRKTRGQKGLWCHLFPHPFSRLGSVFHREEGIEMQAYPEPFRRDLVRLAEGVFLLERELSKHEFSCLLIRREQQWFPLIFHYIKRKLLRVGRLPLSVHTEEGGLSQSNLKDYFGEPFGFLCWDLSSVPRGVKPAAESLIGLTNGSA